MSDDLDAIVRSDLRRTLSDRAAEAPRQLDLSGVRLRARRIRRRRVAGAGVAVALAAAVIATPIAVLGGNDADRSTPPPAATGSTEATDTAVPTQVLDLDALPQGDPPTAPVRFDGTATLPDGTVVEAPEGREFGSYGAVLRLDDGWLTTFGDGESQLVRLDSAGRTIEDVEADRVYDAPVQDPVSGRIAYVPAGENQVVTLDSAGEEADVFDLPPREPSADVENNPDPNVLAFVGDDVLVATAPSELLLVGPDGTETVGDLASGRTFRGEDASADGTRVLLGLDDGGCWVTAALPDRAPGVDLCDVEPAALSPDGAYVAVGSDVDLSLGFGAVDAILDAETGEEVIRIAGPDDAETVAWVAGWESATTMYLSVQQTAAGGEMQYALVRFDIATGAAELAAPLTADAPDPLYADSQRWTVDPSRAG